MGMHLWNFENFNAIGITLFLFSQVVWHSMQEEFLRQYSHYESMIGRCYPGSGIKMEFTIADLLNYFSDIAQSH